MMEEAARSRLGRGLAALIGDVGDENAVLERTRSQRRVPIEFLKPNPRNPRRMFAEAELDELAASIRERGIIQPILVRTVRGAADTYEMDAAHTAVQFSVRHMMINNVRGEFTKLSGKATGDVANPTATTVEATIDAASIDTRNEKRDEHLRSPDFLDTAKFPTITFKSTKVEKAGDAWKLAGDLTLHGQTRTVDIPLDARRERDVITVTGSLPIVLADYGMEQPRSMIELSVADNGTLELQLHFTQD